MAGIPGHAFRLITLNSPAILQLQFDRRQWHVLFFFFFAAFWGYQYTIWVYTIDVRTLFKCKLLATVFNTAQGSW